MRVHVHLVQKDCINETTNVLADGIGILNQSDLLYVEENTKAKHHITFNEDEIVIERHADLISKTTLLSNREGESVVTTDYGDLIFTTKLLKKKKEKNLWMVHYKILSNQECVSEFQMEWQFDSPTA